MGYWTTLYLVDIKIQASKRPLVERAIQSCKIRGSSKLADFLKGVAIDSEGFLAFRALPDKFLCPYVPDEVDGTVVALNGKWYEAERFSKWVSTFAEQGGRVVLHSIEGDGAAFGWEFDGRGRMRYFELGCLGKWE
jgi:hypothetical protein